MKDSKELIKRKVYYEDLLGNEHTSENDALRVNHEVHLEFRKYLESLISPFDDDKIDMLGTTKNLWDNLEFTEECIKKVYWNMSASTAYECLNGF